MAYSLYIGLHKRHISKPVSLKCSLLLVSARSVIVVAAKVSFITIRTYIWSSLERGVRTHAVRVVARVEVPPVRLVVVKVKPGPGSKPGLVVQVLISLHPRFRDGARFRSCPDVSEVRANHDPEVEEDEGAGNGNEAGVEVEPAVPE